MKRIFFLLFLAFVCNDLKAQIYRSEVCFYIRAGQSLTENTSITIISFDGQTVTCDWKTKSEITAKLKESADYWDDWISNSSSAPYNYNSDLSTYSREVYSQSLGENQWTPFGVISTTTSRIYAAFSKDLSSYISWKQKINSETIEDKRHYKRIDKSDLMPNENLYDFLND